VYCINREILKRIDHLEGIHILDLLQKKKVFIILDSGEEITAWLYFYPEPYGVLVESGDYKDR
jgi:gamma-glutamylcyclotransferase (GGCT)/AIG2-like uncharacterized protein YtfP